jgi:hypothetical protein
VREQSAIPTGSTVIEEKRLSVCSINVGIGLEDAKEAQDQYNDNDDANDVKNAMHM